MSRLTFFYVVLFFIYDTVILFLKGKSLNRISKHFKKGAQGESKSRSKIILDFE